MSRNYGMPNPEAPLDGEDDPWKIPPPDSSGWWVTVLLAFAVTVVLLAFVVYAFAHDATRPDLNAWFSSLANSNGYPCCSFTDGSKIDDVDWDTAVVNGVSHYRVRVDHQWIVVNPQEVVTVPNKYGAAVVWVYRDSIGKPNVRCFMPGAGG